MFKRSFLSLLFLAIVAAVLLPTSGMTQSFPLIQRTVYLPAVGAFSPLPQPPVQPPVHQPGRPTPYDVDARNIVIGLNDVPEGFYMDTAQPVEPNEYLQSLGFVSGYETRLINEDVVFESPFIVNSLAFVFMSSEQAQFHFANTSANFEADPEVIRVSVSSYGDESTAFLIRSTTDGYEFEHYFILTRIGNVNAISSVAGLSYVTRIEDATEYTQKMVEKSTSGRSASHPLEDPVQITTSQTDATRLMLEQMQKLTNALQLPEN